MNVPLVGGRWREEGAAVEKRDGEGEDLGSQGHGEW